MSSYLVQYSSAQARGTRVADEWNADRRAGTRRRRSRPERGRVWMRTLRRRRALPGVGIGGFLIAR